jgi:hypothetical protein
MGQEIFSGVESMTKFRMFEEIHVMVEADKN